jgi:hypothetical protein
MSKIFVLQGRGNSGKTTTLLELRNELLRKYPNCRWCQFDYPNSNIKTRDKIFEIDITPKPGKYVDNAIKIGICTKGDEAKHLIQGFSHVYPKCDIIFTAVHTKGGAYEGLKQWAMEHPNDEVTYVSKTTIKPGNNFAINCAEANRHDVQRLRAVSGVLGIMTSEVNDGLV